MQMKLKSHSLPESQAISQEAVLGALPHAVLVLNVDNSISYMNAAAEELLSISVRVAQSKPLDAYVRGEAQLRSLIERVRHTGEVVHDYEHMLAPVNTASVPVNLHIAPMDGNGRVLLAFDVHTRSSQLSAQAAREELLRSSGLMAAMLAHEVKNPLAGIRGAAQLLMSDVGEEQRQLLQLICDEVNRIKGVLAQVEPFSEALPISVSALNVHQILHYVEKVAGAGFARHVAFREEFDPSLPPVAGARDPLVQILINIIKNAAEALEGRPNGVVRLVTTCLGDGVKSGGKKGMEVHILIEDNGPGIDRELQAHLFEPFVSGSQLPGRGLGLAVAAKLAADMGGGVYLDETRPGCTRFRVSLPVVK